MLVFGKLGIMGCGMLAVVDFGIVYEVEVMGAARLGIIVVGLVVTGSVVDGVGKVGRPENRSAVPVV